MSEYEGHKGKAKNLQIDDIETWSKGILEEHGLTDKPNCVKSYCEWLLKWEQYNIFDEPKYVMVDEIVYEIIEDKYYENAEKADARLNPDGTIDFDLYWYNGVAGFEEVFEEAINRMNK